MFTLRAAGKYLVCSTCSCVPGSYTEKMFQRYFIVHTRETETTWDILKEKLGLKKKDEAKSKKEEIDSKYLQPEIIEVPEPSNTSEEMWKPGYRSRTENKRY